MGTQYDQLVFDDRIEIYWLHEAGKSRLEIARLMGRHPTTIWRELKRNSLPKGGLQGSIGGTYRPIAVSEGIADRAPEPARRLGPRPTSLKGWSPEQIAGRLKLDGSEHTVSPETIYRFIYRTKVRPERLYRFLPRVKPGGRDGAISSAAGNRSPTAVRSRNARKPWPRAKNSGIGKPET